jgi:hypothetical protein
MMGASWDKAQQPWRPTASMISGYVFK